MNDAGNGRVSGVADRVGALLGFDPALFHGRHELPGDRIVRVGWIDQLGHVGRHRDRVASENDAQQVGLRAGDQASGGEIVGVAKGLAHASVSTTGVQMTSSMRPAPQASIASRSKPRAIPEASGMAARAARKSASIG